MQLSNFISNCRKPRVIENARGKKICVNCGSCPDCLNAKNIYNVKRLIDESLQHTYCYFITLTYDYENVPTMMLKQIDIDGKKHISCIDVTNRFVSVDKSRNSKYINKRLSKRQLPTYHEEIHRIPTTFNDPLFKKFYKKAHERGSNIFTRKPFKFLPYLSKVDLQRFIKRLRFKVASELDAEIRYFAVGEYTPKHFLPHFHILLFFDEYRVGTVLKEYVNQCWQYGIVDCEPSLSGKGCSSYLASYTNSFTSLPSFLNGAKIRPFSVHSQNLGILYNNQIRDFVYSLERYDFKPFDISIAGNTFLFSYTPQIVHSFFPRCYNYERQNSYNTYKLYTCFSELSKRYGFNRASDLARCVLVDYDSYYNRCILNALDIDDDVLDLSILSSKIQVSEELSLLEQTIYNRVYTCISTSRLFIRNLESPSLKSCFYNFRDFETKARYLIQLIDNFYNQKSIYNLNQQYTLQQEYHDTFGTDNYDIFYPIHDSLSIETNNERYKKIYESSQYVHLYNFEKDINYSKRVKHKELNDLNKIFTNIY